MTVFALQGPAIDYNRKSDWDRAEAENNSHFSMTHILPNCTGMGRFLPEREVP